MAFGEAARARFRWVSFALAVAAAGALGAPAGRADTPQPEPAFANSQLTDQRCADRTYPECRRLRFTYGPVLVTPGNNAQLVGPVTIEKPAFDAYVTRFRPDLVRADGKPPPVDVVHLHHATWLNTPKYGFTVPFMAAGEEKTILEPRAGYGYLVRATDTWQINYMLHNATPNPETLWIVYDLDVVPKADAERHGIKAVEPLWLDVMRDSDHPSYPVFNVQTGYGHVNPQTGRRECAYPRERCAAFDSYGRDQPGNGRGWDYEIPRNLAPGTIVGLAGHLHPGGLRDEVSLVRGGQERRIFNSQAHYFDPGGPISWDMSMTATKPDWRIRVAPGDKIRLNAVYDTALASWYEGMGIAMAWIAPGDASGVDPFSQVRVRERIKASKPHRARQHAHARRRHRRPRALARSGRNRHRRGHQRRKPSAPARYRWVLRPVPIDVTGQVTHGHLPENSNHGGIAARPLTARDGAETTQIGIGDFRYSAGDLSSVDQNGIPTVRENTRLTFYNFDAAVGIWHTITTCRPPCTASTGISYPIANDPANLDSLELGYGPTGFGSQPTAQRYDYSIDPARAGLKPGNVVTYYCRVHPFMRGAFKVVR